MPRGSKEKYTGKQRRQAEHIEEGYEHRGVPARVTFVRKTDATCVKEIVLPDFGIRRALPLNQPVVVSFTPTKRGAFTFVCGLNMMRGQLIVQ